MAVTMGSFPARRLRLLSALLAASAAGACSLGYYAQAVRGQMDLLSRREPIEALIADPATDVELKEKLTEVIGIRAFASEELGLPDNGSYRSYADLQRPFVVWNVFATKEFSIEPEQWCFLVVGCVAYRGYFDEADAERFAERLAQRSHDVFVAPVPAYSTLGRFDDPVLNTMIHWDDLHLAAVMFHELTHQRLYFKGDAAASESLATVVEEEGVRRWLLAEQREAELAEYLVERERRIELAALVAEARERLAVIYAAPAAPAQMRLAKQAAFDRLREDYRRLKESWGGDAQLDPWFDHDLNNARLVAFATYGDLAPAWRRLLESVEHDLQRFYTAAEALAALDPAARHARLRSLAPEATRASGSLSE